MKTTSPEFENITRRLDELLRSDPHLAQPVAYYRALAGLLGSGPLLAPLPLDAATARARLAAGQYLLAGSQPAFERATAEAFFRRVCAMLQHFQTGSEAAAAALDAGRIDLVNLLETLLASPGGELEAGPPEGQDDLLTLRVLVEYTLRPTLRAWTRQLARLAPLETWQRPTCPACGSLPLLAELHKSQHLRLLRCAFCGCAWPYPIRKCVHCANEDPQTQALIANRDDERLFVQTCKRCGTYLKSIFTEEELPHDLLSLEDLASLYLDEGCQKSGYLRLGAAASLGA
jgi:hypothetical protein